MTAERRTNLRPHIYNRNEGSGPWWKTAQWIWHPTILDRYFGVLFKGWWLFGADQINRNFEIEVAVGGEDNILQFGVVLPFLLRWHIGVRLPRQLVRGWVYERREWTLRIGYIGRWVEVLIASDEHMRDTGMDSYYRRKLADGSYDGPWSRAALWPGWHFTFHPHLRDRLLGRMVCDTAKGEPEPVTVPMPEGNYSGVMRREDRVWTRPRWPWPLRRRTSYWIDMEVGIPVPGKGENSWDIEDDEIRGTGGSSPAEAIANVTRAALRQREQHASRDWKPAEGWPPQNKEPTNA
jgi:hypothetical protein